MVTAAEAADACAMMEPLKSPALAAITDAHAATTAHVALAAPAATTDAHAAATASVMLMMTPPLAFLPSDSKIILLSQFTR
jgi:hypothetical protein